MAPAENPAIGPRLSGYSTSVAGGRMGLMPCSYHGSFGSPATRRRCSKPGRFSRPPRGTAAALENGWRADTGAWALRQMRPHTQASSEEPDLGHLQRWRRDAIEMSSNCVGRVSFYDRAIVIRRIISIGLIDSAKALWDALSSALGGVVFRILKPVVLKRRRLRGGDRRARLRCGLRPRIPRSCSVLRH
jgi:hypothetical protein